MISKFKLLALCLSLFVVSGTAHADFPDDLDDVVFIEGGAIASYVRGMPVTARMTVNIGGAHPAGGQNIFMTNTRGNSWPAILGCCNANAWLFVKIGETWYAGTWEFMRVGQTLKSTKAMVGPGHLRFPPLNRFAPQNGEIYGYMLSGIVRNGIASGKNNIQERTDVVFHKFGVGPVSVEEAVGSPTPDTPPLAPILDLLED
ncbi:MAG: hypothetical protein AAF431_08715 [Pseudomonadota bacterium]